MIRDDKITKIRIALKEIFLKDRKEHLIKKIINLLRDKSFNEIDAFESLFLLQRVNVLLSTFIVKNQIFLTLKEINIRLKNLERNTTKIILFIYAIIAKTKNMQSVEFTIVIIATYNNINQQRQLKKIKKERKIIFKIRKQKKRESENAVDEKINETFAKN
jgi:hypothetical protein